MDISFFILFFLINVSIRKIIWFFEDLSWCFWCGSFFWSVDCSPDLDDIFHYLFGFFLIFLSSYKLPLLICRFTFERFRRSILFRYLINCFFMSYAYASLWSINFIDCLMGIWQGKDFFFGRFLSLLYLLYHIFFNFTSRNIV